MMSSAMLNFLERPRPAHWRAMTKPADPPPLAHLIDGFGERLKAARVAAGFPSQIAFARALGVSAPRLANWEAGDHPPTAHHLALLRQKFGIGADWVLSGDAGALSGRILQAMVNLGADKDAPAAARELRLALPGLPDPTRGTNRRQLHEPQAAAPGRLVHGIIQDT